MDNFFEILIYLLIIFSFLGSFFKKKEQEKKPGGTAPAPNKDSEPFTLTSEPATEPKQSESYDILREIENIFKENMGIPVPQTQQKEKTSLEQKEDEKYSEAFTTNYDMKNAGPLSAESRSLKSREAIRKLDEKTLLEAEKFEELLKEHSIAKRKKHPIVDKLNNPQSLKEYILISEILGKPVAYKR